MARDGSFLGRGQQGRAPRAVRAGACPPQPGQPRPWASGTSPAMGTESQAASRAVVGLETASSGLAGAGTDGPRGRSGDVEGYRDPHVHSGTESGSVNILVSPLRAAL